MVSSPFSISLLVILVSWEVLVVVVVVVGVVGVVTDDDGLRTRLEI